MSSIREGQLRIEGTTAPGFESVRALYERNMRTLADRNTQLCVYWRGERVVDLWATAIGDEAFGGDSLVNVFSSSKNLAAIAVAWLVDQGHLDYEERIAHYWPAFAANGKADLKVADLMRHEAGLANFDTPLPPGDLLADAIKENRIGAVVEAQTPRFPTTWPGHREYHAITRGWIANELFRRVDPAGRTIGEFLRDEIRMPLDADVVFGVPEDERDRVSPVVPLGFGFMFLQSLIPRAFGRRIEHSFGQLAVRLLRLLPVIRNGARRKAPEPFQDIDVFTAFNDPVVVAGETPSANANCSARGLARVAAMMAGRGAWQGRRILSENAWEAMHAEARTADMGILRSVFSQGGVNHFVPVPAGAPPEDRALNTGREGFWGWMGFGGSVFQWHPDHEIGFAYIPTSLYVLDLVNERGKGYQTEVLRCVERLAREPGLQPTGQLSS